MVKVPITTVIFAITITLISFKWCLYDTLCCIQEYNSKMLKCGAEVVGALETCMPIAQHDAVCL